MTQFREAEVNERRRSAAGGSKLRKQVKKKDFYSWSITAAWLAYQNKSISLFCAIEKTSVSTPVILDDLFLYHYEHRHRSFGLLMGYFEDMTNKGFCSLKYRIDQPD